MSAAALILAPCHKGFRKLPPGPLTWSENPERMPERESAPHGWPLRSGKDRFQPPRCPLGGIRPGWENALVGVPGRIRCDPLFTNLFTFWPKSSFDFRPRLSASWLAKVQTQAFPWEVRKCRTKNQVITGLT